MSVTKRLQNRAGYLCTVGGESVMLRGIRQSELDRALAIKDLDESNGLVIGFGLLEDDKSQAYTPNDGESDTDFGGRVLKSLDLTPGMQKHLIEKIGELTSTDPDPKEFEALVKNSLQTTMPASQPS